MPAELCWEHKGLVVRMSGALTAHEIIASSEAVSSDPRFDTLRFILVDLSEAEPPESLDISDISLAHAIRIGAARSNARILEAYVINDSMRAERIRNMVARRLTAFPTRIFSALDDARQWINSEIA